MTEFAYEKGRWEPPVAGDEDAILLGFLERQRTSRNEKRSHPANARRLTTANSIAYPNPAKRYTATR